jgi:DNA polymerase-1
VTALIDRLNITQDFVVLDLETTGLSRFKDKIEYVVLSTDLSIDGGGGAAMFPAGFADELLNLTCPLVLHNFKFDFLFLLMAGVDMRSLGVPVFDTMLMHHLLDESASHSLDDIVQESYKDPYKSTFWSKNDAFHTAPFNEQLEYACKDVIYTGQIFLDFTARLDMSAIPGPLVEHVHNLALALYDTEARGIALDMDYMLNLGVDLKGKADEYLHNMNTLCKEAIWDVETEMWQEELDKRKTPKGKAGVSRPVFNWNSGSQLQRLIYGRLGVEPFIKKSKTTKEKRPVLDDEALTAIKDCHPVVSELHEYRGVQKVYTSFIEGVLEKAHDGRIYPSFNVNGTTTGRISASGPNIQQMPRDGDIRGMFIPDAGHRIITCDYGMLEVVIAAHYSHDKNLLKIIYEGASKHDITAAALGIDRQTAKTVNFGCQYGAGPDKLAQVLGTSRKGGQEAYDRYWKTYEGERRVIESVNRSVDRGEAIVSIFGRHRRFPQTFDARWKKEAAYRQAYSSLVQGTGADCCNTAFYQVHDYLERRGIGTTMFPVHDEIVIQAKEDFVDEATEVLQNIMIGVGEQVGLTVPLTVDVSEPLERWQK